MSFRKTSKNYEKISPLTEKPGSDIKILSDHFQILSYKLAEFETQDYTPQRTVQPLFSNQCHSFTILFESDSSSIIVSV